MHNSFRLQEKPKDIVVSYVVFIKEHSQEQDYRVLREAIPVLTNKGFLCPGQSKVQFSKEYSNIDLPTKLPGKCHALPVRLCLYAKQKYSYSYIWYYT